MERRQFLASGTALLSVAVAGCGHPNVVLDLEAASDEDIADEVSATAEPGSEEYQVLTSARDDGSATRSGRRELFDRTDTVRADGAFYEVSETRTESSEVTVYSVDVAFNPDDTKAEVGEVAYDDLPAFDREQLSFIVDGQEPADKEGYNVHVDYGTAEAVGDRSALVPEQEYDIVTHEGNRYRVAVESRTVSEGEYRYEVTEIAPDVETFADQVRERYLFVLSGLSEAERKVVEEAIDGAYYEEDDAFQSVIDRVRDHEGLNVDDFYGTWLLSYEDSEYLTYVEW
ncbi:hypothetical protein BRC84_05725 [Halobacteriales archaeon QS_1_68_44]|nr:MAG: hypothetical protein BRC84_05725 [Halobacteriales archaeon QS_1_68_44]